MNDADKFFATTTGKIVFSVALLLIGFFGSMEYKSYQIRSAIADSLLPITSSFDSARTQADDAKVKANVSNSRAEAALIYDSNAGSYRGLCTNPNFLKILEDAQSAGGGNYVCNVSEDGMSWAATVPLKSDPKTFACGDSTGPSKVVDYPLGSATSCIK